MPSHNHYTAVFNVNNWVLGSPYGTGGSVNSVDHGETLINGAKVLLTGNSGGNGAHNNLQPYITVYMWKRTA